MLRSVVRCALAMLMLGSWGCSSSRQMTPMGQPEGIPVAQAPPDTSAPMVVTKDGGLYRLNEFQVSDSVLSASGTREQNGQVEPFQGQLAVSDVEFAQAGKEWSKGKTLLTLGVAVVFTAMAYSALEGSNPVAVLEKHGYHAPPSYGGGGWSCPFIYSQDGRGYHLESESFSGALFQAAERASCDVLEYLEPHEGRCHLRLTNESTETDHINQIQLLAVDARPDLTVLPDIRGRFHTIASPQPPIRCVDDDQRDVLAAVRTRDERFWESELSSRDMSRDESLRDGLTLEFARPRGVESAKLVVRGINTTLGMFALQRLFALRGDSQLRWYQQLARDPAEQRKLMGWMKREGMLHVQVWQDGRWVEQTALPDVGPRVIKDQVAMLDVSHVASDVVRVRLECATDLWRIDQVSLDATPDGAVQVTSLSPLAARDEDGHDVGDRLRDDDDDYFVTVQGQHADITFDDVPARPGCKRHYAVVAKGYYHPWPSGESADQSALADRMLTEPLFGSRTYMPEWKARHAR